MMLILLCIPVILWTFSLSRTMQTLKKPPLTVLLCLIVCFTLTSCFNTKNKSESVPDNYSLYSQYVDKVVKKFKPEGFEMLNSTADIYSSGFPENEYFEERDDLYVSAFFVQIYKVDKISKIFQKSCHKRSVSNVD